jgi:hypothetical protein
MVIQNMVISTDTMHYSYITEFTRCNKIKMLKPLITQAYKLFTEDKTPVEIAIQLNISEKEVTKYYTEYWRLKGLYRLYDI